MKKSDLEITTQTRIAVLNQIIDLELSRLLVAAKEGPLQKDEALKLGSYGGTLLSQRRSEVTAEQSSQKRRERDLSDLSDEELEAIEAQARAEEQE